MRLQISIPGLLWFCFTSLCDWWRNLKQPSIPVKCNSNQHYRNKLCICDLKGAFAAVYHFFFKENLDEKTKTNAPQHGKRMESCEPSLLYTVKTWQYFTGRNQTFCIGFQTIYWFLFCIWLVREWRVFSEPIMEQSKAKPKQPWTLFDIHNENCLKWIYETIKYNTLHLNTVVQL